MTTPLHTQLKSIFVLTASVIIPALTISAQNFDKNIAFAMATGTSSNTEISSATVITDNTVLSEVTAFTSVNDITIQNYFQLTGNIIKPYMQMSTGNAEFNPELIRASENVNIVFNTNTIEYNAGEKKYTFKIENVDHYINTSDKCLIKTKIALQVSPVKVGKEKISEISVYVDNTNHISFIEFGNSEFYLRP